MTQEYVSKKSRLAPLRCTRTLFSNKQIALLGNESSVSNCELVLMAIAHCFMATFVKEIKELRQNSPLRNLKNQTIHAECRGYTDLRCLLKPEDLVDSSSGFKLIQLDVNVEYHESDIESDPIESVNQKQRENPLLNDFEEYSLKQPHEEQLCNKTLLNLNNSNEPSTQNTSNHFTDIESHYKHAFSLAKSKAPVCNSVKFGIPVKVKTKIIKKPILELPTTFGKRARASNNDCDQSSENYKSTRSVQPLGLSYLHMSIPDNNCKILQKVQRFMLNSPTRAASTAGFHVRVETVGISDVDDPDFRMTFYGFSLGEEEKVYREKPLTFLASNPARTGFPGYTDLIKENNRTTTSWPSPIDTMMFAMNHCFSVSACTNCFSPELSSVGTTKLTSVNIESLGYWDMESFMTKGNPYRPVRFYSLSHEVSVTKEVPLSDYTEEALSVDDFTVETIPECDEEEDEEELPIAPLPKFKDSKVEFSASPHQKFGSQKPDPDQDISRMFQSIHDSSFVSNTFNGSTMLNISLMVNQRKIT